MYHFPVVIIGAGSTGLTAAYELAKQGIKPIVLEKADKVGGISRTETYKGYHVDIGGNRFFTKVSAVQRLWQEVLKEEFIKVPRLSRIYYQGQFFNYPLSFFNTLSNLGVVESFLILLSYLKAKLSPNPQQENLEQWAIARFGFRLYKTFFKTYTEKVWGIPCNQIQTEWAAQRLKGLSLKAVVINALFGSNNSKLVKEFDYPVLGSGMMWQRIAQAVESMGARVHLNTEVVRLERQGRHIKRLIVQRNGKLIPISAEHFISGMPITTLINLLDPLPPDYVLQAAQKLNYRNFLTVALIVDRSHLFPDNWIYIHSPEVKVARIQNFKNWSAAMVPDPSKTCLGMEYFCTQGDSLWTMSDTELLSLATSELVKLGLANAGEVEDGVVFRQPLAYPVNDREYRKHLRVIQNFLATFDNLQITCRSGTYQYNNHERSMLTGMLAATNILGENHDVWEVNTQRSYYKDVTTQPSQKDSYSSNLESKELARR